MTLDRDRIVQTFGELGKKLAKPMTICVIFARYCLGPTRSAIG